MAAIERPDLEPTPGFRFAIEIKGVVTGWFTECGGLSVERTVYPYQEGGLNAYVHQLPDRIKRTNITLKRGIADEALWKWFAGERDVGLYEGQVASHDVTIVLYNVDRTEAKRWNLPNAYPVRWTGPGLTAGDSLVAVETLELAQGEANASTDVQRAPDASQDVSPAIGAQLDTIDLAALAEKVHELLKRESRIERERLGWHRA
jgi:phage tail-like protein